MKNTAKKRLSSEQQAYIEAKATEDVTKEVHGLTSQAWCEAHASLITAENNLLAWGEHIVTRNGRTELLAVLDSPLLHIRKQVIDLLMRLDVQR